MKKNKSMTIVILSTMMFGIISKWLVGIPCMMWGHFDRYFMLAFVFWMLYAASLYIAGTIEGTGKFRFLKTGGYAFCFGMIVSCVKTGIDAVILFMAGKTGNQILLTCAMEIGVLLSGSIVIIFLHSMILKKKFIWDKSFKKYVGILSGVIGGYAVMFFYFYRKFQSLLPYTNADALAESGTVNLSTMLGMERAMQASKVFTALSTAVYVIVFIVFWRMLQKGQKENR